VSALETVRTGIMAGSPCPAELMKKVIAAGIDEMTICYGMTETSPVSTQTRTDDSFDRKVFTVGRVGPHLEIKIVDPSTGEIVPRGQSGEFATKGYSVMLGYWMQPDKTEESVVDGWMRTGDLAVMDEDGYVQITGRIKDMVIRGGENIYPREIEEFLYTHPDILDAQVIGVPDPKYGEELCAWIRMKPGAQPVDAPAIREFATGKLAHYKIPRYVEIVDDFPMTVTGKVRKVEMREDSRQPDWDDAQPLRRDGRCVRRSDCRARIRTHPARRSGSPHTRHTVLPRRLPRTCLGSRGRDNGDGQDPHHPTAAHQPPGIPGRPRGRVER
jgi:fatty-acyl-CoA synthase